MSSTWRRLSRLAWRSPASPVSSIASTRSIGTSGARLALHTNSATTAGVIGLLLLPRLGELDVQLGDRTGLDRRGLRRALEALERHAHRVRTGRQLVDGAGRGETGVLAVHRHPRAVVAARGDAQPAHAGHREVVVDLDRRVSLEVAVP